MSAIPNKGCFDTEKLFFFFFSKYKIKYKYNQCKIKRKHCTFKFKYFTFQNKLVSKDQSVPNRRMRFLIIFSCSLHQTLILVKKCLLKRENI